MPPIRSINCNNNAIEIITHNGKSIFDSSKIPVGINTIKKLEDYLNKVWLLLVTKNEFKAEIHIFSFSPLVMTIYIADNKERIPSNWWIES